MFNVNKDDMDKALSHYDKTLGGLPSVIETLVSEMPAMFVGYAQMRQAVMSEDSHIPRKYKELIFILLDLASGSMDGALIHTRMAIANGLSSEELAEALAQTILVLGISSWDRGGAEIMRTARQLIEQVGGK